MAAQECVALMPEGRMLLQQSLPSKCSEMFRMPPTCLSRVANCALTESREPACSYSPGRDFAKMDGLSAR
ncbi:hypothetical protein CO675_37045 [Bradyrhizobium sp. C9]|nr:hypothetical protein CO675_37045 [Bradyrhizobium sp. C9]